MSTITTAIGTARIATFTLEGVRARPTTVAVEVLPGTRNLDIRGVGGLATAELQARIFAMTQARYEVPDAHVVITVDAPREVLSNDGLDLPVCLGVLAASGQLHPDAARRLQELAVIGSMTLGGKLRRARGTFPAAEAAHRAGRDLLSGGDCPSELEGAATDPVLIPQSLQEAIAAISPDGGFTLLAPQELEDPAPARWRADSPDLATIIGQRQAIRALQVAALSSHRLLLIGDTGVGKRELARRLPALMGDLDWLRRREVRRIQSAMGLAPSTDRPFVAPHRSAAVRGLIGGGSSFRPGYVSLAHRGVLYLEDVAGMPTKARDAALQATADGSIDLEHDGEVRSVGSHALLVGAATPCRCGGGHRCRCTGRDKAAHMEWLKRELFGHFDLVVHVTRPTQEEIAAHVAISTATANAQVNDAAGVLADRVRDPRRDPRLSLIERVAFELAALDGTDEPTAEHRLEASAIASPCR